MKLVWVGAVLCALVSAQTSDFDDLARRASAALQTNPKQAADLYQRALALSPSWAEGWFYLGAARYETGEFPQSRKAFERAAELAPKKGAVWAFLGLCDYQLHDYDKALANILKGESLGLPDNPQFVSTVRNQAALVCIRARDFSSAIEQLQPLARLGDASEATIQAFGVSALAMPYLPAEIPPEKRPLVELAGRAEWAISASDKIETAKALHQLLAQYPAEPGVHYLNAMSLVEKDPETARTEFNKELAISPSRAAAIVQIGILDLRAGRPDAAVHEAQQALRLQPDNALAHALLGLAYVDQNSPLKALEELRAAAKLEPMNAQLHWHLQRVYKQLGQTAEAQKEMAEYLRLRPSPDLPGVPDVSESGSSKPNDMGRSGKQ